MPPQSMTGYGRGSAGHYSIDVRSTNHKSLDININVPSFLFSRDPEIRKTVKKRFTRGRIEIFMPRHAVDSVKLKVNKNLAKEYYDAINSLKEKFSIPGDISIDLLASQRDVFVIDEPDLEIDDFFNALDTALSELEKSRVEEGENLMEDINTRIQELKKFTAFIEDKREEVISSAKDRLYNRLSEFLKDMEIDEARLVQETAFLVERADITEELVRIKSHLDSFTGIADSGDTTGKKMEFFVQELRREVNTIGSKSQDVEIASTVVEMKHELEKIKEQVQNVQ